MLDKTLAKHLIEELIKDKSYIGQSIKSFPYKKSGAKVLGKEDGGTTNLYQYVISKWGLQIAFWVEVDFNKIIQDIDLTFCDIINNGEIFADNICIEDNESVENLYKKIDSLAHNLHIIFHTSNLK